MVQFFSKIFQIFPHPTQPNLQLSLLLRRYRAQGSTDRLVQGPTGPNRSEIFKILLALVRISLWFLKFPQSWSELVRDI